MMRASRRKFIILFLLFLLAISSSPELLSSTNGEAPRELEVVFLDVGQGDAILVTTPSGFRALIDGGDGKGPFVQDQAERVIIPYLRRAGIERLDAIVLTHAHFDHIGGLITIIKEKTIKIGEVLDPGEPHPSMAYLELLQAIDERPEIAYRQPRAGENLNWGVDVKVEVLNPPYLIGDDNESSIVVRITYGECSFLLTGDAGGVAENLMIRKYGRNLQSDILKVGHHGSRHSSTEKFLKYVNPKSVVISCGIRNKHGHPHKEVNKRLKKYGAKIYRTDHQGTITITTDGKVYKITTTK